MQARVHCYSASMPDASLNQLLKIRPFMRFWLARLGGIAANQMLLVAVSWHLYDITGSAWLREHIEAKGQAPALLIRPLERRGNCQSCLTSLESALARELLLSGKIRLVRFRRGESSSADSIGLLLQDLSLQESGADALLTWWLEEIPEPKLLNLRITLQLLDPNSQELLLQAQRTRSKPLWL